LLASRREDALSAILDGLALGEVAWLVVELDELAGPAHRLVRALLEQGVELVSVPGASLMVEGLVASGLPADRFTALGLLPASGTERRALWARLARDPLTLVCRVRPEDLHEVLDELQAYMGDRPVAVCQAGEVWRGPVRDGSALDAQETVTLVIGGADSEPDWTRERVLDEVHERLAAGMSPRDVSREVARRSGWPRRRVYEMILSLSRDRG
jgi:16S rRNA (cytidine1402-2'-O)-methyltransferase